MGMVFLCSVAGVVRFDGNGVPVFCRRGFLVLWEWCSCVLSPGFSGFIGMVFLCYVTGTVCFDGNGVPVLCHQGGPV